MGEAPTFLTSFFLWCTSFFPGKLQAATRCSTATRLIKLYTLACLSATVWAFRIISDCYQEQLVERVRKEAIILGDMAPKADVEAGNSAAAPSGSSSTTKASGSSKGNGTNKVKTEEDDSAPALTVSTAPDPGFRDIPLYSVDPGEWTYHLLKFASHSSVEPANPAHFTRPIKLNRKFPPRHKLSLPKTGDPVLNEKGKRIWNKDGSHLVWPDYNNEKQMQNAREAVKEEEIK